jgi:hypothetical protein
MKINIYLLEVFFQHLFLLDDKSTWIFFCVPSENLKGSHTLGFDV